MIKDTRFFILVKTMFMKCNDHDQGFKNWWVGAIPSVCSDMKQAPMWVPGS